MEAIKRNRLSLASLGAIGFANGFFLAFGLFGLLAALLHLLGIAPPPAWLAFAAGTVTGGGVVATAALRAWNAAQPGYAPWGPASISGETRAGWERAAAELAAAAELPEPDLEFIRGATPNSFVAERAGQRAIVITDGLREQLAPAEQYAALAHEVAHLEAEDAHAVGFADAIWRTVAELGEARGRLLWGPTKIFFSLLPLLAISLLGLALVELLPDQSAHPSAGQLLLGLALAVVVLYYLAFVFAATIGSWRGLLQLFLYCTFFGPLTLVEAVLAWPTMFALARMFSRRRVFLADQRAVELTGEPEEMIAALEATRWVEGSPAEAQLASLRFGLFATPLPHSRYQALVERFTGTHPPAERRIERVRRLAQERSRAERPATASSESLEQSE